MRAFLAIELDEYIKNNIVKLQEEFMDSDCCKMKCVEAENIHLTLKFFGDINEKKKNNIIEVVNNTIKSYNKYMMKIVRVGTFGGRKNPHVIWTGVKDKEDKTIQLIKVLDNNFGDIGFKKEKNYVPHITIGRLKTLDNEEVFNSLLLEHKKDYFGKMQVKSLKLKSSELTPDGPIYTTVKEFKI